MPIFSIWAARGGHGATSCAGLLAAHTRSRYREHELGSSEWIWPRAESDPGSQLEIVDAGVLPQLRPATGVNIVVLRGPCSLALRDIASRRNLIDHLILIKEQWRPLNAYDVEHILRMPISAQIPFSTRLARLVDAGLATERIEDLSEYDDLRRFADDELMPKQPTS